MKICLLTVLTVLTLLSCNQPKENSGENEKLIKQYFEHFNKHDWNKMAAMYSDTAAFKDPSLGQGIVKQTKAEIVKKYGELSQIFPDVKDEVISIYPSGDQHIIVEFVSTGTAPDSSKFELPICTVFKIENGLITQDFTYFDNFEEK
ncbi:nuclear transport factor 2 family protein [Dyadobacter sp. LHD-138]|uniref:nuclear transport factor 2 family protein n=1 Tax=Dyadobacter sp. LHD-138 TaxID=3071413 RepID=UPI0027E0CC85|nr:nuclear transport factor 2 family protein [Dyadobacter sp. LHD-138]MDQ6477927.1 nuclear transport factor 2 family protein [Dyadobacter sp. LHD-138]